MNYDCGFTKGNKWFRYRAGGIIVHNGKLLLVHCGVGNYCYVLGGAVKIGETSEQCILREVLEETGMHAQVDRLAVVCENFFDGHGGKIDGLDCHTLEFYYRLTVDDRQFAACKSKADNGEALVWLSLDQVAQMDVKPNCVKQNLHQILTTDQIIHIFDRSDK